MATKKLQDRPARWATAGLAIRRFRTERVPPLTTRQVEERIRERGQSVNLSHSMLSQIEAGRTRPSVDKLEALSEILRVPYARLLKLYEYPVPEEIAKAERERPADPVASVGAALSDVQGLPAAARALIIHYIEQVQQRNPDACERAFDAALAEFAEQELAAAGPDRQWSSEEMATVLSGAFRSLFVIELEKTRTSRPP
jgi:transcriptional regulator with XRE-family HTH domain